MPINEYMNMKFIALFTLVASLLLLNSGCSSPAKHRQPTAQSERQGKVIQVAKSLLGAPYHYGGRHPDEGFDCSGLVYYSHLQAGYELPRTSYAQFKASTPVSRQGLKAGDLVFFRIHRSKISHVGIYLGNERFIHAPSSGKKVRIGRMSDPYWRKRFVRGGRIY